ncbi:MAG: YebC/PmpR family DNA-binding transcriptional regulator [Fimbriimonas ginsengisoli]|uniref:Probable transcriptional regulatory protein HYR64_02185 n=1 Tax=Fimbriimonas ginsengisoli TaxID=1005039 RepID=A0A931LRC4_FIMGI|nr:YebC/PmpR family DNA-binding transcriptional regulator [Fimbriimonas ginsengisoli]MBI3721442.1 YebC/PmpR family DNA-binding transcriptional regulator [Fimbriimonas ginsengisoli]
MAGHSKWKNIRIRKGRQDAIRGKLFTKLSREIIVAAKTGGGDPDMNARLRVAIAKAREASVPVDNIKRSVQRGTGELEGADFDEVTYEGYGPGGAAILVECTTENRNRTVADLRHAFAKSGGNLAENGSVSWQFKRLGQIVVDPGSKSEEEVTLLAIDAGAQDVVPDDEGLVVYTAVEDLHSTNEALERAGLRTTDVELTYVPSNKTEISSEDAPKVVRLLEMLEDLDDVQETYLNVDLPEDLLQEA